MNIKLILGFEVDIMNSIDSNNEDLVFYKDYVIFDISSLYIIKDKYKEFFNIIDFKHFISIIVSCKENETDICNKYLEEYVYKYKTSMNNLSIELIEYYIDDVYEKIVLSLYKIICDYLDGIEFKYTFHVWLDENTLILRKRDLDKK